MDLKEYDVVRVVRLDGLSRRFDGTAGVSRPPAVGDVGAVVHVFPGEQHVTVEAVRSDGMTLWLADFAADELEVIHAAGTRPGARGPDVEAEVTFLAADEGGRSTPAQSGYRPQHAVRDDYFTTGVQEYLDVEQAAPGATVRANITFLTPEAYPGCLWEGKVINVQEGSRVVGRARILKIFNPALQRLPG